MKKYLFILTMAPIVSKAQTFEFYGGVNTSKYVWTPNYSLANSSNYENGVQFGMMWGPKQTNFLGLQRRIEPNIGIQYNSYRAFVYKLRTPESSSPSWVNVDRIRVSVPIRVRVKRFADKRIVTYALADPGYDFRVRQEYQAWSDNANLIKFADFSMNIGFGALFKLQSQRQVGPRDRDKKREGYHVDGISVFVGRSFDFNPSATNGLGSGSLHQYNINVGLKFAYKKKKFNPFRRS